MARIRTIKPEFFRHEELYEAEKESGLPLRVAFAGLWTVADREGRFKWKPNVIKMDVLPWDEVDFSEVLSCLAGYGFIIKYTFGGIEYGTIPSFSDHQVINNREGKSKLPPPPVKIQFVKDAPFTRAHAASGEGKEGKGREGNIKVACEVCGIFGKAYLLPDERLPTTANWFRTIDEQVDHLLKEWEPDVAVKQIKAYLSHCKSTQRKVIGTNHKVAETLLSANWLTLSAPDHVPKPNDFAEAAYNRKLWTEEAWQSTYEKQIKTNGEFREYFKISNP